MDPRLWHQKLASKLEELGLRKNKVEPCIFTSEQLIVMHHLDTLLLVGDKLQQESFISQLSSHVSLILNNTTKLDAKTPLSFMNQTLEYSHQDHSISLSLPTTFYMKLSKMCGMTKTKAKSTPDDQLGPTGGLRTHKPLTSARHKLYRSAVGQLLWATSVRPDISFAVQELSRSLHAPTRLDEKQLQQVLGYLHATLHFTVSLQPPRKKVLQRASSIPIQACFDTAWSRSSKSRKATSGVSLSLWGVPVATSQQQHKLHEHHLQQKQSFMQMGMAVQDSLHLQSFLQEMHLFTASQTI